MGLFRRSGLFNTMLFPSHPLPRFPFHLISWNARALLCKDVLKRSRKILQLEVFAEGLSIGCIQEVHGNHIAVCKHLYRLEKSFWFFSSFLNPGTGGVLTMISKNQYPNFDHFKHDIFVPGRVTRLSVKGDKSELIIWNVHNQDDQSL